MMSCCGVMETHPVLWAEATGTKQRAASQMPTSFFGRIFPRLKLHSHRSQHQARLAEMAQIAPGALPRNAARTQSRPVVHIRDVVGRDAPRGRQPFENSPGISEADVERVVLRCVRAVDVIHRAASYVLPIETQEHAPQGR